MALHLETKATDGSAYKIILQQDEETYMIFVFKTADSDRADEDRFAGDLDEAKRICLAGWGVAPHAWTDIIDPRSIEYLRDNKAEGYA